VSEGSKQDFGHEYEVYSRRAHLSGYVLVAGLAFELINAVIWYKGLETLVEMAAVLLIVGGVWGEIFLVTKRELRAINSWLTTKLAPPKQIKRRKRRHWNWPNSESREYLHKNRCIESQSPCRRNLGCNKMSMVWRGAAALSLPQDCSSAWAAVECEGSQTAVAKRHGVHRVLVNMVLNGKRPVNDAIAKALWLRNVYVAE
jgi:hypothetical protein